MRTGRTSEKTLVVGLGISGRAVCALLRSRGAEVSATDLRSRPEFNGTLDGIEEAGCSLRLGYHRLEDFLEADRIIVSPGDSTGNRTPERGAQRGE